MWGFLGTLVIFFASCEIDFKALRKFAPREEDAAPTAFAFESNVGSKTCDDPLIGAAWVRLAKTEMIVELEVEEHGLEKRGRLEVENWRLEDWRLGNSIVKIIN